MIDRTYTIIYEEGVVAKDVPENLVMDIVNMLMDKGYTALSIVDYVEKEG